VKTLWDPRVQDDVTARLTRLTPEAQPAWGRMTCPEMVVHITDVFRLYAGDLAAVPRLSPLRYAPLKHAVVYLLPMPRNVATAPEVIGRTPDDWVAEMDRLRAALTHFVSQRTRSAWPAHPIFGRLSCRAYGVLAYKHTDHHLRQFGV
jgi:hypothetical protein